MSNRVSQILTQHSPSLCTEKLFLSLYIVAVKARRFNTDKGSKTRTAFLPPAMRKLRLTNLLPRPPKSKVLTCFQRVAIILSFGTKLVPNQDLGLTCQEDVTADSSEALPLFQLQFQYLLQPQFQYLLQPQFLYLLQPQSRLRVSCLFLWWLCLFVES